MIHRPASQGKAYLINGQAVRGRCLLATRPAGAGPIASHLTSDPAISVVPLTAAEVAELVLWNDSAAPVEKADEAQASGIDVQALDIYVRFVTEKAAAAGQAGMLRLFATDHAGQPKAAVNVSPHDWRAFRTAALAFHDRRWNVSHTWALHELGTGNDETPVVLELAEFKTKAGNHSFEIVAEGETTYGVIHAKPLAGAKLAMREQKRVIVPGLALWPGEDTVPSLPEWTAE